MKHKFINAVCLLIGAAALITGCAKKGPNFREFTYAAQTASGMNFNSGFAGMNVTIKGTNF